MRLTVILDLKHFRAYLLTRATTLTKIPIYYWLFHISYTSSGHNQSLTLYITLYIKLVNSYFITHFLYLSSCIIYKNFKFCYFSSWNFSLVDILQKTQ